MFNLSKLWGSLQTCPLDPMTCPLDPEAEELFAEAQKMAQLRYKTYIRKAAENWED